MCNDWKSIESRKRLEPDGPKVSKKGKAKIVLKLVIKAITKTKKHAYEKILRKSTLVLQYQLIYETLYFINLKFANVAIISKTFYF